MIIDESQSGLQELNHDYPTNIGRNLSASPNSLSTSGTKYKTIETLCKQFESDAVRAANIHLDDECLNHSKTAF